MGDLIFVELKVSLYFVQEEDLDRRILCIFLTGYTRVALMVLQENWVRRVRCGCLLPHADWLQKSEF